MFNHNSTVAKKYIFNLLQEDYLPNEEIITRITHQLATEKDVTAFCQVMLDVWRNGYMKAVSQYKDKLKDLGYEVVIK